MYIYSFYHSTHTHTQYPTVKNLFASVFVWLSFRNVFYVFHTFCGSRGSLFLQVNESEMVNRIRRRDPTVNDASIWFSICSVFISFLLQYSKVESKAKYNSNNKKKRLFTHKRIFEINYLHSVCFIRLYTVVYAPFRESN